LLSTPPRFDPYDHDPDRWGVSLSHAAELMLPCLDAAGVRSVVEVGAFAGDLTRVLVAQGGVRIADRPVFTTTGRLASPAWSPDGSRVLVRWTDADEWLLLPATPRRRPSGAARAPGIVAIARVARRFSGTPAVRGWCCASR